MNQLVLDSLATAIKADGVPASLEPLDGSGPTSFLYNPESKSFARSATYAEAVVGGKGISAQNYIRSSGRTLELPNLLLDSHCAGKSLRQLLEGLERLLLPSAPGKPPKVIGFRWGSEYFSPAVLTAMSWEETGWLSGEPALARVNLSLLQLPAPETASKAATAPSGQTQLTARQQAEGVERGKALLAANRSRLPAALSSAFGSGRFKLLSDSEGAIALADSADRVLGKVGRWDGFKFWQDEKLLG